MNTVATNDSRVSKFCALVNEGMQAWVRAGELLNEMTRDDPLVIGRIVRDNPHLTREILESFQRIGRKEVLPILMVDGSPGARLLAGLPYEDQERVYAQGVRVVKQTMSGPIERKCRVSDLTAGEAKRVFDVDRIRSVREQKELLKTVAANHHFTPREPDRAIVVVERCNGDSAEKAVVENGPHAAFGKALDAAHLALMQAREALVRIKEDSPQDAHIATALGAVGKLRFLLNEGEI